MSKMNNMNEQMYGVAELTPTSKPQPAGEGRASQVVQPMPTSDLKKERVKKKHHGDFKLIGGSTHSVSADVSGGKKKISVPPYKGPYQTVSTDTSNDMAHFPLVKKHSSNLFPFSKLSSGTADSDVHTSASNSVTQVTISSTATPTIPAKERKKKTKKRKSSHVYESPSVDTSISAPNMAPDPASLPSKPRPEALSLPADNISTNNDVPDTGDVRHMLQELLHPQSVSLVTPIPTPNKVKPFIFPSVSDLM